MTKQNCFEAKRFNAKTTHDGSKIKHFNESTAHDAFAATRFNFETEHFNFDLKRFNEMTKRDAFRANRFNFNSKSFNGRLFSGEIESRVLKIDSAKDILDDFRTKRRFRDRQWHGSKFWWGELLREPVPEETFLSAPLARTLAPPTKRYSV